jgi:hypothetical protein
MNIYEVEQHILMYDPAVHAALRTQCLHRATFECPCPPPWHAETRDPLLRLG